MFFKEEKFFSRRPHPASLCCSILLAGVAPCVNLIVQVGDKSHLAWLFLDVFVSSRLAGKGGYFQHISFSGAFVFFVFVTSCFGCADNLIKLKEIRFASIFVLKFLERQKLPKEMTEGFGNFNEPLSQGRLSLFKEQR